MADISTITLLNGETYSFKDAKARSSQNTWYGTCGTTAGTQTKVVTTTTGDFTLTTGNMVRVKFTNAQTYNGGIKLNVDGTGAVNAMRQGTTVTVRYFFLAGEVVDFVYDGTNFVAVNEGIATTTYYGVTKLVNATNSTSTSTSATPNSVKLAYDLADSKSIVSVSQTLTSGTEIGSVTVDGTATTLYAPSDGDTVTVQQTLTSGTEIGGVTVNGTQTKLYAPSGGSALTDAEIEEAIEDAFVVVGYAITYDHPENYLNNAIHAVTIDGVVVEGEFASAAPEETTVTMVYAGDWEPVVTRDDTSASIACTKTDTNTSSGGGVRTTWIFTMPDADVTVGAYYND